MIVERALRRVLARLDALGVHACADQLYYATCRALIPPLHRRPGFLLPRPIPRAAFDRALAATSAVPVPDRLPVLAGATDATDLTDYGLPRVLVCQHDAIAAALLANDLHMEAATVILGSSQVTGGVPALLAGAAVHLLHDATLDGLAWRAGIDGRAVGLSSAQARMLHLVGARGGGAQVAAVPPEHLLRVLRRSLAGRAAVPVPTWTQRAALGFLSWPGDRR